MNCGWKQHRAFVALVRKKTYFTNWTFVKQESTQNKRKLENNDGRTMDFKHLKRWWVLQSDKRANDNEYKWDEIEYSKNCYKAMNVEQIHTYRVYVCVYVFVLNIVFLQ